MACPAPVASPRQGQHLAMTMAAGPVERQLMAHTRGLHTAGRDRLQILLDLRGYASHWAALTLHLRASQVEKVSRSGVGAGLREPSARSLTTATTLDLYKRLLPVLNSATPSPRPHSTGQAGPTGQADPTGQAGHPGQAGHAGQADDPGVLLDNLAHALGLAPDRLCSTDPELRSAERARLMQGLVQQAQLGMQNSPALRTAQKRYEAALQSLSQTEASVPSSARTARYLPEVYN